MGAIGFIVGRFAGERIGVTTMCGLRINRIKDKEMEAHSKKRISSINLTKMKDTAFFMKGGTSENGRFIRSIYNRFNEILSLYLYKLTVICLTKRLKSCYNETI